jgi:transglutaminase-like putative cysteine protease
MFDEDALMRLKIRHQTIYRYEEPALSAIQLVRKTPRNDASQFVRRWRIDVDADCRLTRDEDAFGNITHMFSIDGPLDAISVLVEGEVETNDQEGFVRETAERFPLGFWRRPSSLTEITPAIADFARDFSMGEGGDVLAAAHAINQHIHKAFAFVVGETDATTPAADVLKARRGVCQDFAHLFIAAMRVLGRPTRYVSGYIQLPESEQQVAGHAWAEAHFDGLGWIAFDPANGICGTDRHVRIAVAPDYRDAAPIRGSRQGGKGEQMEIAIEVKASPSHSEAMGQEQVQNQQAQNQ